MNIADVILNFAIWAVTLAFVVSFFRKDGDWAPERGRFALRFFTCLSNILCADTSFLTGIFLLTGNVPQWVWTLKYMGTAAVTVTMLTVFFILAPSVGKDWYGVLLKKPSDKFMHLLTPLAALVSFFVFEKRGMTFPQCLWGMLPVALYGPLYLYKILYAPEEKRWDDFYGFNRQGRWPVMFAVMVTGTFLICLGIRALQNL